MTRALKNTFSNKPKRFFETFPSTTSLNTLERYMSDREKHFETNKKLQNELKKLFTVSDAVPSEVDQRILKMAEKQFARKKPTGRVIVLRWAGRAAAVAAVVFITLFVCLQFESKTVVDRTVVNEQVTEVQESIRPSGQITILDAFALARNIDAGKKLDKSWDLNGDGIIDKRDVDAVAFAAVRLHEGVQL
jgi:hypothetical protein